EVGAVSYKGSGYGNLETNSTDKLGSKSVSNIDNDIHSTRDIYTTSLDWSKVTSFANIGIGGKLTFSTTADNYREFLQQSNEANPMTSTNFEYKEDVQAVYFDISKSINSWDMRFGLRAENTITEAHEFRLDSINTNNYFELFPTFSLSYTTKNNSLLAFSYNRRLSRPWMWALNPRRTYIGDNSVIEGSPFLRPSFGNYLTLKYAYKKMSFTIGGNFQDDMFNSQTTIYSPGDSLFVIGRYNNYKEQSYYANFNVQIDTWSLWTSYNLISGSYFKNQNTDNTFSIADKEGYSLYLSSNNTFYPLRGKSRDRLSISLNFWYKPDVDAGREISYSASNLSLGANWNVIKDKLNLTIWASDVFANQKNIFEAWVNSTYSHVNEYNDIRSVQFSLKYNFGGNVKVKHKNVNQEEVNRL
ncbi:MAG: outer membrane beta-barrel family protein, partial [Bacteroidales bacterium]